MYKEHFKLIIRKLLRNKIYTVINVLGLAIALTAAFLIYDHVAKEFTMDRFHKNGKEIYRITEKSTYTESVTGISTGPLAPALQRDFPGIKDYARMTEAHNYGIKASNSTEFINNNQAVFADFSMFRIFSFPLVSGNIPDSTDINSAIITERIARKYFGQKNPIGQIIVMKDLANSNDPEKELCIRGVMKDLPNSSSIQADLFVNLAAWDHDIINMWGGHSVYTFLLLEKQVDIHSIEAAIPSLIERNYQWIKASEKTAYLQPLRELYFQSGHIESDQLLRGSLKLTGILCGITLLILILASCNYFMIKIAQLSRNFSGFAIQRCYGAGNRHIFRQLLSEITIHMSAAFALTVVFALFLHPYFVQIISPRQLYPLAPGPVAISIFLVLIICFTFLIGLLLYSYLIRKLNKSSIKSTIQTAPGQIDIKKMLTLTQMAIFCALLFCSVILSRQMNYVKNKSLEFNKDNVLSIYWQDYEADLKTIKNELKRNPDILAVSSGVSLPEPHYITWEAYMPENPQNKVKVNIILGDEDFLDTYQIQLTEGRSINPGSYPENRRERGKHGNGHYAEVVVNQQLVKKLRLQNPVGTILYDEGIPRYRIVGVTKDFHYLPLYEQIKPMLLIHDIPMSTYNILIRYQPDKRAEVTAGLKDMYQKQFPNTLFTPSQYQNSDWYDKDLALAKLIHIFTFLAIFISGMGIFAFSMFMSESKCKEVAIRKISGASEREIITFFNQGFTKHILLACVIGMPIAGYAMQKWLEGFAYKTSIEWWIAAGSAGISIAIVLAVANWQIWNAATRNPVESIKSE